MYASRVLKDVTENYKNYLSKAQIQKRFSIENFSLEKMQNKFCEIIDKALENIPQQMPLKLPKLTKV